MSLQICLVSFPRVVSELEAGKSDCRSNVLSLVVVTMAVYQLPSNIVPNIDLQAETNGTGTNRSANLNVVADNLLRTCFKGHSLPNSIQLFVTSRA